ncbi:MAG: hypothetical protein J6M12_03755 [Clostridia bacterium]|nr:hypothetical protein [Clostridia bacterium]
MSGFRNFGISFVAALVLLGGVAYWAMGLLANMFDPNNDQNNAPDWQDTQKWEDPDATAGLTPIKSGRSFNMVIIGTDYDPKIYNDYQKPENWGYEKLFLKRKVEATAILFVRFDKESRSIIMSSVPSSTAVMVDHVPMTLGQAYGYKGAEYVKDTVSALTGMTVDFSFVFSGRDFAEFTKTRLLDHRFTVPFDLTTGTDKGLAAQTFTKGQVLTSSDDLYTLIHHDDYDLLEIDKQFSLMRSIFLQTLKKITVTNNPTMYYNSFIAGMETNMTAEDVTQLIEVLYTLPLYIDATEDATTVKVIDLYKLGSFSKDLTFTPDYTATRGAFESYKK